MENHLAADGKLGVFNEFSTCCVKIISDADMNQRSSRSAVYCCKPKVCAIAVGADVYIVGIAVGADVWNVRVHSGLQDPWCCCLNRLNPQDVCVVDC